VKNGWASRVAANAERVEEFCPAKVNLFLAVTGRRDDGFHNLVSVVAPLDIGDRLEVSAEGSGGISFTTTDPTLPTDGSNLVIKAVEAFRRRHPIPFGLRVALDKRLPAGAGLGGGSSDAAGMLRALNRLTGSPLGPAELASAASEVGSDCPLFLAGAPVMMRGRGELVENLAPPAREALRGQRLLLLKPPFGVPTVWAYRQMARRGSDYLEPGAAEARIAGWAAKPTALGDLLFNNMEPAVFDKFVPLAVLKSEIARRFGAPLLMSGSGSTLLVLLRAGESACEVEECFREACGESGWAEEARIQ